MLWVLCFRLTCNIRRGDDFGHVVLSVTLAYKQDDAVEQLAVAVLVKSDMNNCGSTICRGSSGAFITRLLEAALLVAGSLSDMQQSCFVPGTVSAPCS